MAEPSEQQRVHFAISGREVKIGLALDPARRVDAMRIARPDVKLLGDIAGGCEIESQLHHRFAKNRIGGEWFRFTIDLEDEIDEVAR